MQRFEEKYSIIIRGIYPLLMHRFAGEKRIEKDRQISKSGSDKHDPMEEAITALYKNEKGIICQPANHIEGAMIRASVAYNMAGKGKKTYKDAFKGGIFIEPQMIPHKIQKWELDLSPVNVQRAKIMRARPRFDKWELEFTILNIDDRIRGETLKQILIDAGRYFGIGDNHPRNGRFDVIKFERIKNSS